MAWSDILIALTLLFSGVAYGGCILWIIFSAVVPEKRIERVKGIKRFYEINAPIIPFPGNSLTDSLVENDHKENEGTQH